MELLGAAPRTRWGGGMEASQPQEFTPIMWEESMRAASCPPPAPPVCAFGIAKVCLQSREQLLYPGGGHPQFISAP